MQHCKIIIKSGPHCIVHFDFYEQKSQEKQIKFLSLHSTNQKKKSEIYVEKFCCIRIKTKALINFRSPETLKW